MLNFNTPIIDTKEYSEIKISEIEPILKINLRGKNRDFITKIGKELSEPNVEKIIGERKAKRRELDNLLSGVDDLINDENE